MANDKTCLGFSTELPNNLNVKISGYFLYQCIQSQSNINCPLVIYDWTYDIDNDLNDLFTKL